MLLSWFYDLIGKYVGEDRPIDLIGDPPDFQSSVLLDCGILWIHVFSGILIYFPIDKVFFFVEIQTFVNTLVCQNWMPRSLPVYL